MGSIESVEPTLLKLKRETQTHHLLQYNRSSLSSSSSFGLQRSTSIRSRFARLLFFTRIHYLQWVCAVCVFFFFALIFQMQLPGSVMEKSLHLQVNGEALEFLKEFGGLGIDEDAVKFEALKLFNKFRHDDVKDNETIGSRKVLRFGYRKPKLALVFADLFFDAYQLQMASTAAALREIGYNIEVFSLEDGPLFSMWRDSNFSINIIEINQSMKINIDWLNYDGLLVNSLQAVEIISGVMQEPFTSVPLIWTIHEQYAINGGTEQIENWKKVFNRANIIVFPNYILPMTYSAYDAGNYFVIPGAPVTACESGNILALENNNLRAKIGYEANDFIITIIGSQIVYKGLWLDHALVLKALLPLYNKFPLNSHLKIIILAGYVTSNYTKAVESIGVNLGYPKDIVKHLDFNEDSDIILSIADIILYSSFLEEQIFPDILRKAMCLEKLIVAPGLFEIKKYVSHKVNGYVFPKQNINVLTNIMLEVVSDGKLSVRAKNVAINGKKTVKNLMVRENVEGYASLLEHVLRLPSEVAKPEDVSKISREFKSEWKWGLFRNKSSRKSSRSLDKFEEHTKEEDSLTDDKFLYEIWEEQRYNDMIDTMKRKEEDELKDRTVQTRGTWDEVYRNARRAEHYKSELHERDEGELERTGQPLTIYEPYYGQGSWSFLHRTSLYRGIGLMKGRRPGFDDVDATSRLPLLNKGYYRELLCEYGAFFAIANRIDRVHKNAWIGFQSWRVTAKKGGLERVAEKSLLNAIQARKHGDALYFWSRMDMDSRNPLKQDFWSFCDAVNAGNCRFAFSEAIKKMYGVKNDVNSLPPMPIDGDSWSVMHSWVLPTRSFVEFIMFSRMFVDALDMQFYDVHHQSGYCYLSLSKDKQCYSRVLELLINVWAYHSARRMIYVNPSTGLMEEQHKLKNRRGKMWVKWFRVNTLKSMDEDLAEEVDMDSPKRRLWPLTGEVFWQGIYEKERNMRNKEKEKKRQKSKDKISRIRKRTRQKALGKYIKPPPEEMEFSNSTLVLPEVLR